MSFQAAIGDLDGFPTPPASTFLHSPRLVRLSAKQRRCPLQRRVGLLGLPGRVHLPYDSGKLLHKITCPVCFLPKADSLECLACFVSVLCTG